MPTVVPMLAYRDGIAAMDWLIEAFGFVERERWLDDDGRLSHGELAVGDDGVVMLATPTPLYEGPARHREHCAETAAWSAVPYVIDGVLVEVDDLDGLFDRVKAAGARILSDREPGGDGDFRHFRVEDLEGHRWMFSGR
jgi:PhnB protein